MATCFWRYEIIAKNRPERAKNKMWGEQEEEWRHIL
jgi:hypothetical protein